MNTERPHGNRSEYTAGRCQDECCLAADRAYRRRYRKARALGHHHKVNAQPVRAHVQRLIDAGITRRRIAELAGVSRNAVTKLLNGAGGRPMTVVRTTTARALLAVPADPRHQTGTQYELALGAQRRLQALVAFGYSQARLARELGISANGLGALLRNELVTAWRAREVRDLYERLSMTLPATDTTPRRKSVTRAKRYALDHGWAPPMAWDEGALDDPDARPHMRRPAGPRSAQRPVDEVAVARVLAGHAPPSVLSTVDRQAAAVRLRARGTTLTQLAKTLGCSGATAKKLADYADQETPQVVAQ